MWDESEITRDELSRIISWKLPIKGEGFTMEGVLQMSDQTFEEFYNTYIASKMDQEEIKLKSPGVFYHREISLAAVEQQAEERAVERFYGGRPVAGGF